MHADPRPVANAPTSGIRLGSREVVRLGVERLTDDQLLHFLAGGSSSTSASRVGESVLSHSEGLIGLASAVRDQPRHHPRLSQRQVATVMTALELARRIHRSQRPPRPEVRTAQQVVDFMAPDLLTLNHEELHCLPLDPHSRLIGGVRLVSLGDVDGTDAGPRAFFRRALLAGATSCIAVHNHPTGDPTPSGADRAVTLRLAAAGRAVDIPLIDHVIIGDASRFTSLRRFEPGLFR